MAKWTNKGLEPPVSSESENHIAEEDIARLADGSVADTERGPLFHHINRCQRCYRLLNNTLKDSQITTPGQRTGSPWQKSKVVYALAASIILVFIISGHLAYKYWTQDVKVITATLELDQSLKDILMEDDALQFGKSARLNRLLAALQQNGLPVKNLKLAVLSKPYYQKKSLFGPKEVLQIRIENEVAYLDVQEKDLKPE